MGLEQIKTLSHRYPILRMLLFPAITLKRFFLQVKNSYQEEIYENFCKMLISDPVLRVDEFEGIFMLDCRSDLFKRLIMTKQYEPELVKQCLRFLNRRRDVVDVGANIGFYTVLFAKNLEGKKVFAIEPTVNALRLLHKNIQLNKVGKKVVVFEGAVSNKVGITEIKFIEGKEEYSTLGAWKHPAISNERYISKKLKVETIDQLVTRYSLDPGFMKVDVEGMEHFVFEGSKIVLENNRPIILSELSNFLLKENGSSSKEVITFIRSYDYDVIDALTPIIPPEEKNFTNILCIPKEMKTG